MTAPRQVGPGRIVMLTRRAVLRMFLLRPDEVTNETFAYCVAEAAARFAIGVILPLAMSNHHHTVLWDRYGTLPAFMQRLHQHLARAINAHRGRWESLWSSAGPSVVELVTREAVMDKLVYVATNPVTAHLVEHAYQWPGFNGYRAWLTGKTRMTVRKPAHFFREDGPLPDEVTLELVMPPELGERDAVIAELRQRVEAVEAECAAERRRTQKRIVGRGEIRRQSPFASPDTYERKRVLNPRVATRNKWARIEALQRNREFVRRYRIARKLWLSGVPTVFPAGTWWLHKFAGVPVEPWPERALLAEPTTFS